MIDRTKNNHELKAHPAMYMAVSRGAKTFEIRKDDRAFQAGDVVRLRYYDPLNDTPFPRPPAPEDNFPPLEFTIGFVLRGGQYGIEPGYVAFSLLPIEHDMLSDEEFMRLTK